MCVIQLVYLIIDLYLDDVWLGVDLRTNNIKIEDMTLFTSDNYNYINGGSFFNIIFLLVFHYIAS